MISTKISNLFCECSGLIPISYEKYTDVQHLKDFCRPESASYFSQLPYKDKK